MCAYCVSSFMSTMASVKGMNTQSRTAESSSSSCCPIRERR